MDQQVCWNLHESKIKSEVGTIGSKKWLGNVRQCVLWRVFSHRTERQVGVLHLPRSGLQTCSLWRTGRTGRMRTTGFSRSSSRSAGTAGRGGRGFWSADWGGKHRNLPSSLSAGSPPTPPARDTTEEEFHSSSGCSGWCRHDLFKHFLFLWVVF